MICPHSLVAVVTPLSNSLPCPALLLILPSYSDVSLFFFFILFLVLSPFFFQTFVPLLCIHNGILRLFFMVPSSPVFVPTSPVFVAASPVFVPTCISHGKRDLVAILSSSASAQIFLRVRISIKKHKKNNSPSTSAHRNRFVTNSCRLKSFNPSTSTCLPRFAIFLFVSLFEVQISTRWLVLSPGNVRVHMWKKKRERERERNGFHHVSLTASGTDPAKHTSLPQLLSPVGQQYPLTRAF